MGKSTSDKAIENLSLIAQEMRELYAKYSFATESKRKYLEKKQNFEDFFTDKLGLYVVFGIISIAVLFFDFWVTRQAIEYLAELVYISKDLLAFLIMIIDAGLAIIASGGLAGSDYHKQQKMKKIARPILYLLGLVKIILYVILVYNSYLVLSPDGTKIFTLTTWEFIRVVAPQVIFLLIIYSVLSFAGIGLFYLCGLLYYGLYLSLLNNPETYEKKIKAGFDKFSYFCNQS